MTLDLTAFDPVLKDHYVGKKVNDLAYLNNPLYAMVAKNTKAGGKSSKIIQPVKFKNPHGASNTFANALANKGNSEYEDFQIPRKKVYQLANIDNETIHASLEDMNAFLPAMKEVDYAMKACGDLIAHQMYRTSGGYIGTIDSTTTLASTTLVFSDSADVFNIQKGDKILFGANADGSSPRNSGATLTITAVNREAGTVTTNANISTVTGTSLGDYIFIDGCNGAALSGLADWLPATSGGVGTLHSVDRSTDVDRLGGIRRTANGEPIDETVIKLTATIAKHGGNPSHVFLNPETLSDLILTIGSKSRYEMVGTKVKDATIGFDGFKFLAGGKTVTAYGDYNCPSNRLYVLQMDTWTLHSAGKFPMFLDRDGLLQRSATADEYEVRCGGYGNLGCSAPGYNGVGVLS